MVVGLLEGLLGYFRHGFEGKYFTVTSFENFASFLFGVGAVRFKVHRRVAFLFRVAAAYVSCSEGFGGVPTLGSGAGCG